jgi:hypothetical protein
VQSSHLIRDRDGLLGLLRLGDRNQQQVWWFERCSVGRHVFDICDRARVRRNPVAAKLHCRATWGYGCGWIYDDTKWLGGIIDGGLLASRGRIEGRASRRHL